MNIYRPLYSLFLTRHLTVVTGSAPRLRLRVNDARMQLHAHPRRSTGIKKAWKALFPSKEPPTAEFEYGGSFPLSEIIKLARARVGDADEKLLNLISRADRSQYEEYGSAFLTSAELALFDHIAAEHTRLSRLMR
jgi:hypothetical protein